MYQLEADSKTLGAWCWRQMENDNLADIEEDLISDMEDNLLSDQFFFEGLSNIR